MKEYFGYSLYSFYDMEKDLVDSKVNDRQDMMAMTLMTMMLLMMMMMMTSMIMILMTLLTMMMICIQQGATGAAGQWIDRVLVRRNSPNFGGS